jgi:ABC-type nitrate/sulfonate/bicarbonate transport system substrate-binding protein
MRHGRPDDRRRLRGKAAAPTLPVHSGYRRIKNVSREDIMPNSRKQRLAGAVAAMALLGWTNGALAQETQLRTMVFAGIQNLPLFAAEAKGFWAKHQLKIEQLIAPNSGELRNGLAEGRYQIVHGGVDNAVAMMDVAKVDIAVLMGGDNGFNSLMVQSDIRSYADLKGKTLAVDATNTAYALVLYQMLKNQGLQRGTDYDVKPVGATVVRVKALIEDKSLAAGIVNLPFSIQAEKAGLKNMGAAVQSVGAYQATAGWVRRDWGQQNEAVVVRYIRAYVEGLRWSLNPANRAEAVALLANGLKIPADIAEQSYIQATDARLGFARDAAFDLEGFRNVLKIRAEFEGGGAAPPPAEKYLDLSYYQKALAGLGS